MQLLSKNMAQNLSCVEANSRTLKARVRARNVVIEFPSHQAALDCWNSPEYKKALEIRKPISTGDVVIIEGYDDPQPS